MKFEYNWPSGLEEKMFENVDGQTDARVTGILLAHLGAFSSGELKTPKDRFSRVQAQILVWYGEAIVYMST